MRAKRGLDSIAQGTARATIKALLVSAGLSILFLIVYSGCNWITARRAGVGTFYFEWERRIPFVPFMILPYMSIDLFFVAAPFLCRSERALRIFSRRVMFAIVVSDVPLPFSAGVPMSTATARGTASVAGRKWP